MSSRRDTIRRMAEALDGLYDRHEAEAIARAVLIDKEGITRSHLLVGIDEECTVTESGTERIISELASGRPLQYILGHCEFCGLDFEVGEGVLIPRPETEELVAAAARRAEEGCSVLDLCTGSGCIAVALAKQIEKSTIIAADISQKALEYARRNARRNSVNIEFVQADIFNGEDCRAIRQVLRRGGAETDPQFDIIVSNPPYVPQSDIGSMHVNVKNFEPHEALFVPDGDPLLFYERIAELGREMLRDGGLLCFEIYELHARRTAAMLAEKGYRQIETIDDANLKPRVVCCRK